MHDARGRRLPVVGIMGSGTHDHGERAAPLGAWLAGQAVHLLTGGGGGVMEAVSRSFCQTLPRRGLCIGILPAAAPGAAAVRDARTSAPGPAPPPPADPTMRRIDYPNAFVELVIRTHLPYSGERGTDPLSRNHINVLSADIIVAMPGSAGTASEVHLAARYGRPLIAYLEHRGEIPGLPAETPVTGELDAVKAFIRNHLAALPGAGPPHH
ncbi:MAG: molybdenum cofactor carrier protein [Candidatus Eisenbacteria sp.]|nr:molybdenum cofactor carrier protein [Candidatus Eisenbacteria bacterium]